MILYIDPGTGSMLFTILFGVLGAGFYVLRNVIMKVRFIVSGGNQKRSNDNSIPFVFFTDSKRYYSIFKPLCDEMEKRREQTAYYTASADDPLLKEEYNYVKTKYIGEGNKAFAKMNILKADIVLSTTPGLDVYQWKRSRDVKKYVHILHAANGIALYRMFGIDYFDALLLSGEYQIRQIRELEKKRNLPTKEIELVGLPHMDSLRYRFLNEPEMERNDTTVLLAPSWGPNGILSKYGEKVFEGLLRTSYHIIVRPHPQSFVSEKEMLNVLMTKYPNSERIEWDRSVDNFDVLKRSDVLISDFSGVIFDYALVFDKPLIYADTSFDNGMYDAWWLDEKEWTFDALERIGIPLTEDRINKLQETIEECLTRDDLKETRKAVRDETWVNIGKSVKAIVDYLVKTRNKMIEVSNNNDGQVS